MTMISIHEKHWAEFLNDNHQKSLYDSWWIPTTVNYWRHSRLLAPVLEVMSGFRNHSWLTIGDGAGTDAWRMLRAGFTEVLATDLDDTVLRRTKEAGYITRFSTENAEKLSFPDNSFDFILCSESLHHMSRPYAAIYEFFRVARYGIVIIEPQDPWIDWPCLSSTTSPHYESVGNYVYQYSARELEKVAYGLNITGVATRNLIDIYLPGCEFAYCVEGDAIWQKTREGVEESNLKMKAGEVKPNYVQCIFFKNPVTPELFDMLAQRNQEWRFLRTDTNPYLNHMAAG